MEALNFTTVVEEDGIVRVPRHILEAAGMCPGTELHVFLTEEGIAAIRVQDTDPDQAGFWTPEWQAGMQEAIEDLRAGRVRRFASDEAFMEHLQEVDRELVAQGR